MGNKRWTFLKVFLKINKMKGVSCISLTYKPSSLHQTDPEMVY